MGSWLGGAYDAVAGAGDWAAGSVDETIGRQFDDEPGGGFADADTWIDNEGDPFGVPSGLASWGGGIYDSLAGAGDYMAGNIDESIARQFDDEPGGGFADWTANQAAGLGDWAAGDVDEWVGRNTMQTKLIVGVVVLLVLLYLARPVLEAGANVTEG